MIVILATALLLNAALVIAPALGLSVIVGCPVAPALCGTALAYMAFNVWAFKWFDNDVKNITMIEFALCASELVLAWGLS